MAAALSLCLALTIPAAPRSFAENPSPNPKDPKREQIWASLATEAKALGLPTRFLSVIDPGFVTVEFADLRTYAAEYDPDSHRMRLNLPFSFNMAGGVLRPLANLAHSELGTLYHELFHAYMDYIGSRSIPEDAVGKRLLEFARHQQRCRYERVSITPVVQRKGLTEVRFLTERESWEALNETWGSFIGWSVWSRLEVSRGHPTRGVLNFDQKEWLKRLKEADQEGWLVGYYEPEDPEEHAITQKRYLAPANRISPQEVAMLLELFFEQTPEQAARAAAAMVPTSVSLEMGDCAGK